MTEQGEPRTLEIETEGFSPLTTEYCAEVLKQVILAAHDHPDDEDHLVGKVRALTARIGELERNWHEYSERLSSLEAIARNRENHAERIAALEESR